MDFLIQNVSFKASYAQAAQRSQIHTRELAFILDSIEHTWIQELQEFNVEIVNLLARRIFD